MYRFPMDKKLTDIDYKKYSIDPGQYHPNYEIKFATNSSQR